LIEVFIQGEIGQVFHVFLNHPVFRKETDIISQLRADNPFAKDDNEGIIQLRFLLHLLGFGLEFTLVRKTVFYPAFQVVIEGVNERNLR
jgi:hypothetical protein